MHCTRNNTCIHANHLREYQSQLWNNFRILGTLERSLVQTATLCEHNHDAISIPKIYKSRSRDRRKNQSTAQVPEHINQTAANTSNDPLFPRRFRKTDIRLCRNLTKLESSFPTRGEMEWLYLAKIGEWVVGCIGRGAAERADELGPVNGRPRNAVWRGGD